MIKKAEPVAPVVPPSAPIAAPSPTQAAPAVKAAPVEDAPHTGTPESYVMKSGKYHSKTLGELLTTDPKYLAYLRSSGSEEQKTLAGKVIDAKPPMPEPVPTAPPASAPTTPPVVTQSGQIIQPEMPAAAASATEADQKALVAECRNMMKDIKEFQGTGIAKSMIPFLRSIGGTKFDYTVWTIAELQTLKTRLLEKLGK